MALETYAELKQEIIDWLDRDDLTTKVDSFIRLAEARHRREVRIREMITRASITVVTQYSALPTGYLSAKTFRLLTDPLTILTPLNLHEMNNRRRTISGKPIYFTIHSQIEFDRPPDTSYPGEMIYYQQLPALGTTNANNSLLVVSPDIYLYSSLAASAPFLVDDDRIAMWDNLYVTAKDEINLMDTNPVGSIQSQVSGPTP